MDLPFIFSHQNTIFNSPPPLPCGVVKYIPQGKPSSTNGEGMPGMVSPIEEKENREGIRLTKEILFHNLKSKSHCPYRWNI
jgi:hypothetical protein